MACREDIACHQAEYCTDLALKRLASLGIDSLANQKSLKKERIMGLADGKAGNCGVTFC